MIRTSAVASEVIDEANCVSLESTVAMPIVRALVGVAERVGADRRLILQDTAVAPEVLDDPNARATRADLYRLCEAMLLRTGRADLGLHCAEVMLPQSFNPVSDLVYHAHDLRESMSSLFRFQRLLADDVNIRMVELDHQVMIRCVAITGASLEVQRLISELAFALLCRRLQVYRPGEQVDLLAFAYPAPSYAAQYHRIFGAQATFDEPITRILFPRAWLDARSPAENPEIHRALSTFSERKLGQLARSRSLAQRVHDTLLKRSSLRKVEMHSIARELGLSERSLRRHLLAEGTTFAIILDRLLAAAAMSCLVDQERSIQETAYELGFADRTAFHRAFRRWTGTTPSELQHANRYGSLRSELSGRDAQAVYRDSSLAARRASDER